MTDTDRDAAPAAAEGADLSTERLDEIERTAIAASRYAAEPYRVVKDKWGVRLEEVTGGILAEHGELPEDDPYFTLLTLLPPSVVIALVRAARPAPAAAPREGGEDAPRIALTPEQLAAFEAVVWRTRSAEDKHDAWETGQAARAVFDFIEPDELIAMVRAAAHEAARGAES